MSKAFDLSHIKAKVSEMDDKKLYEQWLKTHSDHQSSDFSFLLPRLFNVARKIGHDVLITDPITKLPYHMRRIGGKTLGLCQTDDWTMTGSIYLHPELSSDERVRVLAHEITHGMGASRASAGTNELTAETVAHLVCREFGFDTWNFTYPYLAYNWWCEGGNFREDEINGYANAILDIL